MDSIQSPPNFEGLLADHAAALPRIVQALDESDQILHGKYLHWKQLSNFPLPPYLTIREWWLALKLQRLSGQRAIGLLDGAQKPFCLGTESPFAEFLHTWDRADAAPHSDGWPQPSLALRESLAVSAMREEAITSAQLDGAQLDYAAALELLRLECRPANPGERMALNIHRTLARVREICAQPLTLGVLADLHQRLTAGTLAGPGAAGKLRRSGDAPRPGSVESRLLREPPPAAELPARLKAMLAFANGRSPRQFVHPLLRAAALHFWVVYDMPFAEGNGRLARALFFWSALRHGYEIVECLAPSAVWCESPAGYLRAFHHVETDDNDLMYFAANVFAALDRAQRHFRERAALAATGLDEARAQTARHAWLNDRQRAIVAQALREPRARWLLQEHARNHRLVRQTARNDFAPLVGRGWFEEAKVGRALAFFPAADLAEKIGAG